jgi:alanine racemase
MKTIQITIDEKAMLHNLHEIKKHAPASKILAMVKANAYGHGLLTIGNILLNEVDGFGIARMDEALLLRKNFPHKKIVLLSGFFNEEELTFVQQHHIDVVIHRHDQIQLLKENPSQSVMNLWIKVDTGMNRLGFSPEEALSIYETLNYLPKVHIECMMTHFACANEDNVKVTQHQFSQLRQLKQQFPNIAWSSAKSGTIFSVPEFNDDWIRPGIALYGINPFDQGLASDLNLKPVMTLRAKIISIHAVKKNETVGYGGTWTAPQDTTIAIVTVGYADGYSRHMRQGTPVLINGRTYPLIGRVCMEMLIVELGHSKDVQLGDDAILWGDKLPIEQIAKQADTTPYELLCNVKLGR